MEREPVNHNAILNTLGMKAEWVKFTRLLLHHVSSNVTTL